MRSQRGTRNLLADMLKFGRLCAWHLSLGECLVFRVGDTLALGEACFRDNHWAGRDRRHT